MTVMPQGTINTLFSTYQADLFESGLVAEIGTSAFAVWCAIKVHSDFNNGISYPGIRRLMEHTGLASATVQRALQGLERSRLLRSVVRGRRRYYVARERLDVKLGQQVICSVVMDYIPKKFRQDLERIKGVWEMGEQNADALADVEIIPGAGFIWDAKAGLLRSCISMAEVSPRLDVLSDENLSPLAQRVKLIARRNMPNS